MLGPKTQGKPERLVLLGCRGVLETVLVVSAGAAPSYRGDLEINQQQEQERKERVEGHYRETLGNLCLQLEARLNTLALAKQLLLPPPPRNDKVLETACFSCQQS